MISVILLVIAFVLFIVGLICIFGLGWMMFIFDFITRSAGGGHVEFQKMLPPARTTLGKLFGLLCIITSFVCFLLAGVFSS